MTVGEGAGSLWDDCGFPHVLLVAWRKKRRRWRRRKIRTNELFSSVQEVGLVELGSLKLSSFQLKCTENTVDFVVI